MKLNFDAYRDKVYACWIGKNIGGTMGAPYEGKRQMQNITGFVTKPNEVLPNDDLDLQLVWLHAVEAIGPFELDCKKLGEFWCSFIVPYWNEYGIGKMNMQRGLPAPLSGDYENSWKDSNGAWIRTEIWATLAPASPDIASLYAIEDAKVDHGAGEGTVAAAFVAAMQSAAFVINDIRVLIEIALSKISAESRVAKSIVKLLECYDNKMSAVDARNAILELNSDIGDGWFESPSNVAYAVLGLLWGEGDFKKSMITAINCGDDTDCTGATVGATLGIMYGTKGIPEDWREYIGDSIITVSINRACLLCPKTCNELTDHVVKLANTMLIANKANVEVVGGEDEIPADIAEQMKKQGKAKEMLDTLEPYSFTTDMMFTSVTATWDEAPSITAGGKIGVTLKFNNKVWLFGNMPYNLKLRWILPEGFTVEEGKNAIRVPHWTAHDNGKISQHFVITAGEKIESINRIVVEVVAEQRPTAGYVPLVLLG